MPGRLLALVFLWPIFVISPRNAGALEPVVVVRDGGALQLDGGAVARLPADTVLLVHRRVGNQAWVETIQDDTLVGGWTAASSLRPYKYRPLVSVCLIRDCRVEAGGRSITLSAGVLKIIDGIDGRKINVFVDGYGPAALSLNDVIPHLTARAYFQGQATRKSDDADFQLAKGVFHFYAGADGEVRHDAFLSNDAWTEIPVLSREQIKQSFQDARHALTRAIELGSTRPEAPFLLALLALQRGEWREANVKLQMARDCKLEPQDFFSVRAAARRLAGDIDGSLADFEQALRAATDVARMNLFQSLHQWLMERQFAAFQENIPDSQRVQSLKTVRRIGQLMATHLGVKRDVQGERPDIESLRMADPDTTFRVTYPAWEELCGRKTHGHDPGAVRGREMIQLAKQRLSRLGLPYAPRIVALDEHERIFLPINWGRPHVTTGRSGSAETQGISAATITYLKSPAREWNGGSLRVDDVLPQVLENEDAQGVLDLLAYERDLAREKKDHFVRSQGDQLQNLLAPTLVYDRADLFRRVSGPIRESLAQALESDKSGQTQLSLGLIELSEGRLERGRSLVRRGRELHQAEQDRRHEEELEQWRKTRDQPPPNFNVIGPQAMRLREAMRTPPQRHEKPLFQSHICEVVVALLMQDAEWTRRSARRVYDQRNFSHEALLGLGEAYAFAIPSASNASSATRRIERRLLAMYQLAEFHSQDQVIARYESLANMRRTLTRSASRFVDRPPVLCQELLSSLQGQHAALHSIQCSPSSVDSLQDRADWIQARVASEHERMLESIHGYSIANRSIENVEEQASPWRDLSSIQDSLHPRQAAVEFIRGRSIDYGSLDQGYRLTAPVYGAWVLRKNASPTFVNLGDAEVIERQLKETLELLREPQITGRAPVKTHDLASSLRRLAELVLDPLKLDLSEVDELTLAPDGELWLLPWCALRLIDQRYLAEASAVNQRFTIGDIGEQTIPDDIQHNPPVVFADADFDAPPEVIREQEQKLMGSPHIDFARVPIENAQLAFTPFAALPASAAEADAIVPRLKSLTNQAPQVFTRDQALEAVVKRLEAPEYLVFSSHGYFLPTSRPADPNRRTAIDVSFPLVRGGIVLAGANHRHEWGEARGCDGILTSHEVAFLNLRHTRLVALSGCDTGRGDLPYGEGVAGLRQAFFLAGAHHVLASLWSVEDRSAAQLMSGVFRQIAAGRPYGQALRAAQLEQISHRKERYGDAHPFFWAAWTLTSR